MLMQRHHKRLKLYSCFASFGGYRIIEAERLELMVYDVFLSYASSDKDWASMLTREMQAEGLSVFYDRESLSAGVSWVSDIRDAISKAKAFVVIEPDPQGQSDWLRTEMLTALHYAEIGRSLLIPVIIENRHPRLDISRFQFVHIESQEDVTRAAKRINAAVRFTDQPATDNEPSDHQSPETISLEVIRGLIETDLNMAPVASAYLMDISIRAGATLTREGRATEALSIMEDVLNWGISALGEAHPSVFSARATLANVLIQLGDYDAALILLETSLNASQRVLGQGHSTSLALLRLRNTVAHAAHPGSESP